MTTKEQLKKLDDLFHDLYEGTKTNVDKLQSDKKEYETIDVDDDDDIDYNEYIVPQFVKEYINSQAKLMNKIYDEYNKLCDMVNTRPTIKIN